MVRGAPPQRVPLLQQTEPRPRGTPRSSRDVQPRPRGLPASRGWSPVLQRNLRAQLGAPRPAEGAPPRRVPASRGSRQDARRPGGTAARRSPRHSPRPPAASGRRTVPAAWIGEPAPARPAALPAARALQPRGDVGFGVLLSAPTSAHPLHLGPLGAAAGTLPWVLPPGLQLRAGSPAGALPLQQLHTLTLSGSPRLSVLLGRCLALLLLTHFFLNFILSFPSASSLPTSDSVPNLPCPCFLGSLRPCLSCPHRPLIGFPLSPALPL